MERRTRTLLCLVTLALTHLALAQNPTISLIPLVDDVRRECVGGPNDGQVCSTTSDCEVGPECQRVCVGGPDEGEPCSTFFDCVLLRGCTQKCSCDYLIEASPSDVIAIDILVSDWAPNGEKLKGVQTNIEMRGIAEVIHPIGYDRPADFLSCRFDECPVEFPICDSPNQSCEGPNHNPDLGSFFDKTRTDYVFFALPQLSAINNTSLFYKYGQLLLHSSDAVPFTGPRYAATLIFEVVADVGARFTLPLDSDSLLLNSTGHHILPIDLANLTVEVVEPPQPAESIPATSTWSIVVLSLSLLAGAKVYFGRKAAA